MLALGAPLVIVLSFFCCFDGSSSDVFFCAFDLMVVMFSTLLIFSRTDWVKIWVGSETEEDTIAGL